CKPPDPESSAKKAPAELAFGGAPAPLVGAGRGGGVARTSPIWLFRQTAGEVWPDPPPSPSPTRGEGIQAGGSALTPPSASRRRFRRTSRRARPSEPASRSARTGARISPRARLPA